MPNRLNVLYLHSHDTGRWMQPYGYPVSMPAYQRLAESGVVFRKAFSAAPTCSPSRAALLTGEAPHSAGMLGLAHRGFALSDPTRHLAAFMRRHGYQTILAGHQHLTRGDPHELGYEVVLDCGDRSVRTISANAVTSFHELAGANGDRPFFLDVGFEETHRPFPEVPEPAGNYVAAPSTLPDLPAIRRDVAAFQASLILLDNAVGEVLAALESNGLAQSTVVLLTTDHGPAFPGMKSTLSDAGLGVGLILRVPGARANSMVSDALVSHIDVYPTLCDVLDLPAPPWLQGVSLVSLLDGSTAEIRSEVFAEVTFHAAYEPQRSIRTERWIFIRRFGGRNHPILPNVDVSPSLDCLLGLGWDQRYVPEIQLFDNLLDPAQSVDLATSPLHAPVVLGLDARLHAWMARTGDPLLRGPVPLPPAGVANRPEDRSPDDRPSDTHIY